MCRDKIVLATMNIHFEKTLEWKIMNKFNNEHKRPN